MKYDYPDETLQRKYIPFREVRFVSEGVIMRFRPFPNRPRTFIEPIGSQNPSKKALPEIIKV